MVPILFSGSVILIFFYCCLFRLSFKLSLIFGVPFFLKSVGLFSKSSVAMLSIIISCSTVSLDRFLWWFSDLLLSYYCFYFSFNGFGCLASVFPWFAFYFFYFLKSVVGHLSRFRFLPSSIHFPYYLLLLFIISKLINNLIIFFVLIYLINFSPLLLAGAFYFIRHRRFQLFLDGRFQLFLRLLFSRCEIK